MKGGVLVLALTTNKGEFNVTAADANAPALIVLSLRTNSGLFNITATDHQFVGGGGVLLPMTPMKRGFNSHCLLVMEEFYITSTDTIEGVGLMVVPLTVNERGFIITANEGGGGNNSNAIATKKQHLILMTTNK